MIDSPFTKGKQPDPSLQETGIFNNPTVPVPHNNGSKVPVKFFEELPNKAGTQVSDTPFKNVVAPSPGASPAGGRGAPRTGQTDSPFTKGKQ